MSAAKTFARLRGLGAAMITTGEAAAALRLSKSSASRALRDLGKKGLVRRIRRGLWSLEPDLDPHRLTGEITRPYPSYISFESALSAHGAIDQLPREITVATLGRPRRVRTSVATYRLHRLPPALFGGFEDKNGAVVATPEKALVDYFYVAHASGRRGRGLPELDLPADFSRSKAGSWLGRIRDPRLRERVRASVDEVLGTAEFESAPR